jgi:DNA-binding transcriptional ArsR family regulator
MPAPDPDLVVAPEAPPVSVAVEPAQNALNSLLLIEKADRLSGLDEWVTRTAVALTPQQRWDNRLVMLGLHYAVVPDRSWPSFTAYVDHLASVDPTTLRDRVFRAYAQRPDGDVSCSALLDPDDEGVPIDIGPLLESLERFLGFLRDRFRPESIDVEIETEAHRLLNDPPAMQALIVSHFRAMWREILSSEWQRVLPMLEASVDAFGQLGLVSLSKLEAVQVVLGRNVDEAHWGPELERTERLVFVPSAHLGPYAGKFKCGGILWLLFGARIPAGVQAHAPDLTRAELLVRINALADDARLRILRLVSEEGEQRSQDIMARLDFSQSAASRHLTQLSATGYLIERRCNGAKCYELNPSRIEDTLNAISLYLLGK